MNCLRVVLLVFVLKFHSQALPPKALRRIRRFEPCFRLRPLINFHLHLSPNHFIQWGNVSLEIGHPRVPSLIKAYYDFALTKIQGAYSEDRNSCFQKLNAFIYKLITNVLLPFANENQPMSPNVPQDVYLWKLQTIVRFRLHEKFRYQFVPSGQFHSTDQGVQRACQIPKKIMRIHIDKEMEFLITDHDSNPVDGHIYAEKGCFSFFEQRAARGTSYFKDSGIYISSPYFLSTNLLAFPDGTQLRVSKEQLFSVLMSYYKCTMLEILAVSDSAARLCYVNLFNKNMQLFLVKLKKQEEASGLDVLLTKVKEPKPLGDFGKSESVRSRNIQRWITTDSSGNHQNTHPATNPTTEMKLSMGELSLAARGELGDNGNDTANKSLDSEQPMESPNPGTDEFWEKLKYHIVLGVCIILGLVFFLIVFLVFFIAWLAYASRITKMRQEQDRLDLLQRDRDEQSDDMDETAKLLNKPLSKNK